MNTQIDNSYEYTDWQFVYRLCYRFVYRLRKFTDCESISISALRKDNIQNVHLVLGVPTIWLVCKAIAPSLGRDGHQNDSFIGCFLESMLVCVNLGVRNLGWLVSHLWLTDYPNVFSIFLKCEDYIWLGCEKRINFMDLNIFEFYRKKILRTFKKNNSLIHMLNYCYCPNWVDHQWSGWS